MLAKLPHGRPVTSPTDMPSQAANPFVQANLIAMPQDDSELSTRASANEGPACGPMIRCRCFPLSGLAGSDGRGGEPDGHRVGAGAHHYSINSAH